MDNINDKLQPQLRLLHILMTSNESFLFKTNISSSNERYKLAKMLTSDLDLFAKIATDRIGSSRIKVILAISDENVRTILFYPIISRFTKIMTHENGYGLGLLVLRVCNIMQKKIFCHRTYHYALDLACNEYGCIILKKVITIADDLFKDEFLDLIAHYAYYLSKEDLGISLIQHVLTLDFTQKTTQDHTCLHELMAEFDEILSKTSDIAELEKLALKLTSDSDLFVEFVKTGRGSLMVQIILGKSEEIDMMFLEVIKQRFTDVITCFYGYHILVRTLNILMNRENFNMCHQIVCLIGDNALYLTKNFPVGKKVVHDLMNSHNSSYIAFGLYGHYIELSFLEHGSDVVEKLVGDNKTGYPLHFIMIEIMNSDEDKLMRLAKDEYGNKVLKKTLEVGKEPGVSCFFVQKLKPLLDRLRGSHGENIAHIIDDRLRDQKYNKIVLQGTK